MGKKKEILLEERVIKLADVEGQSNTSPNMELQHLAIFALFLELLLTMTYQVSCSSWSQPVYDGTLTSI